MRRSAAVLAALAGPAAATAACQLVVTLEANVESADPGDATAASLDVVPQSPKSPDPCDRSTLGPRTLEGGTGPVIDLALGYIELDPSARTLENDAGVELCPAVGFDLDEKATCYDDAGARVSGHCASADLRACPSGPSCANPAAALVCDTPGGIDNALGQVANAAFLGGFVGLSAGEVTPNAALSAGTNNVLVRIAGYSGEADDDQVGVQFFGSTGLASSTFALPDAGLDASAPVWDQRSRREWYVDPSTVHADSLIPNAVGQGYVTGHVLVASVDQFPLPLGSNATVLVEGVQFSAELRSTGSGWSLVRGRIGGYVKIARVLRTLFSLTFATGNQVHPVCGSDFEAFARSKACSLADLARANDAGVCDALSFGATFVAVPAIIGDKLARSTITVPCDASVECP